MSQSIKPDNYYGRPEVSNSDLSWLYNQLYSNGNLRDPTEAYLDGSLLDAMITEQFRVNYFKRPLDDRPFKKERFENSVKMKGSFWKDEFCSLMASGADAQKISIVHDKEFNYQGYKFLMDVRCKWDLWRSDWGWGGDIKSTTATTQLQFEAAALFFNYDRQRAWYMDIENSDRDVLIGISKIKPYKVFKIFINRNSDFYRNGKEKYMELAFRHYLLFGKQKAA